MFKKILIINITTLQNLVSFIRKKDKRVEQYKVSGATDSYIIKMKNLHFLKYSIYLL